MKTAICGITVIASSLLTLSSFANEKHDLKCTLDSGEEMTVRHSINTVYIGLQKNGGFQKKRMLLNSIYPQEKPDNFSLTVVTGKSFMDYVVTTVIGNTLQLFNIPNVGMKSVHISRKWIKKVTKHQKVTANPTQLQSMKP